MTVVYCHDKQRGVDIASGNSSHQPLNERLSGVMKSNESHSHLPPLHPLVLDYPAQLECQTLHLKDQPLLKLVVLFPSGVAERVAHDLRRTHVVVTGVVHVPMNPQAGMLMPQDAFYVTGEVDVQRGAYVFRVRAFRGGGMVRDHDVSPFDFPLKKQPPLLVFLVYPGNEVLDVLKVVEVPLKAIRFCTPTEPQGRSQKPLPVNDRNRFI